MKKPILAGLIVIAVLAFATEKSAHAGGLDKVKASGVISVGYIKNAIPFSYLDGDKPVGYSIDISKKIIEAVKAEIGLPELKIRWVAITPEDRLALIASGAVNFECSTTPHTVENESLVGFSASFYLQQLAPNRREAYGCTYPIKDRAFQSLVNRSIVGDQFSGAAGKLYKRWFDSPIPPLGVSLNRPIPEGMIGMFILPNDRPY